MGVSGASTPTSRSKTGQQEVAADDTCKGYWEWVKAKIEEADEDEPDEE